MAEQPLFRAYTVIERENQAPFWLTIGVAFLHKDDKGLNVILQALPLDGKLVLRAYEEQSEESKDKLGAKGKKPEQALEQA